MSVGENLDPIRFVHDNRTVTSDVRTMDTATDSLAYGIDE